ncbi:MAG: hypothetical protein WD766_13450 [Gemmatimonadota bacterium]
MTSTAKLITAAILVSTVALAANPARAQVAVVDSVAPPPRYEQVVSANPFGLLLEFFNAEYERAVTPSTTAGLGGSMFTNEGDRYLNADLFWRYYMSGVPIDGWAFGAKLGITNVPDAGTFVGGGFDVNRSWLVGANQNFYVGVGLGLKRLFGAGDADFGLRFVPTIRLINVGIAF